MFKKIFVFVFLVSAVALFDLRVQAASSPVFGPKKYVREKGAPEETKETINVCATSGTYRLVVENGSYLATDDNEKKVNKKTRISAGEIKIDGNKIIKEDDFKKKAVRVEKTVTLSAGTHVMQIEVEGKPGAFITVALECVSGCVEIMINSPSAGAATNNTKALVRGAIYNADGEVGAALSSSATDVGSGEANTLAQVHGGGFAGSTPLASGTNTITAIATDTCGYKAWDTITINTVVGAHVEASASPDSGIVSSSGAFSTTLRADARINAAVAGYSWDTDGDGTIDASGKDLSSVEANYTQNSLYFPRVIVTDAAGNQYSDTTVVNVVSQAYIDALLKGKWDGMKGALATGDVGKAVGYFAEKSRDMYRYNFSLMSNILPSMTNDMGNITFVKISGDMAEYEMMASQDGNTQSFYLEFARDKDGIWRIKFF